MCHQPANIKDSQHRDGTVEHIVLACIGKVSTAASPSLNATQRAAASVPPATVQAHVRQQRQGIPTWSVGVAVRVSRDDDPHDRHSIWHRACLLTWPVVMIPAEG